MANLNTGIRKWYNGAFPDDDWGRQNLQRGKTFFDLAMVLGNEKTNFYDEFMILGDSIVRERCFAELANIFGIDYDIIYNAWLDRDKESLKKVIGHYTSNLVEA